MTVTYSFKCPHCGEDREVDVVDGDCDELPQCCAGEMSEAAKAVIQDEAEAYYRKMICAGAEDDEYERAKDREIERSNDDQGAD